MSRYFFICAGILLMSSCCKKKACAGDELPDIVVKIVPAPQGHETVTLYTLESGKTDSTFIPVDGDNPSFHFFPMKDFDDTQIGLRQFIIRYHDRMDTVQHLKAAFRDVKMDCDSGWGCGRSGNDEITIKKLMNFSFLFRGKTHLFRDTVFLN